MRTPAEVAAGMDRVRYKGTWYVHPLRRGTYSRRPHFYVFNERTGKLDTRSFCEHDERRKEDLVFNLESGSTMEIDPLAGDYQMRRECGTCRMLITPSETTGEYIDRVYAIQWERRG